MFAVCRQRESLICGQITRSDAAQVESSQSNFFPDFQDDEVSN